MAKKKYTSTREANRAIKAAKTPLARVRIANRARRDLGMQLTRGQRAFSTAIRGGATLSSSGRAG